MIGIKRDENSVHDLRSLLQAIRAAKSTVSVAVRGGFEYVGTIEDLTSDWMQLHPSGGPDKRVFVAMNAIVSLGLRS